MFKETMEKTIPGVERDFLLKGFFSYLAFR